MDHRSKLFGLGAINRIRGTASVSFSKHISVAALFALNPPEKFGPLKDLPPQDEPERNRE